jgi:hypothetical protein
MQVERGGSVGRQRRGMGCGGCLAVIGGVMGLSIVLLVVVFIFFRAQITNLGLSLAGVETLGNTQQILALNVTPVPTIPPLDGAVEPETFNLQLGPVTDGPLSVPNNAGVTLQTGQSSEGYVAVVTTTERDFVSQCLRASALCGPQGEAFGDITVSNLRPDFNLGSVVLTATVRVADVPVQQNIGLVFRLNAGGNRFEMLGVDLNGFLFADPPPEIQGFVDDAEAQLNNLVAQVVVDAAGMRYTLDRIVISEQQMALLLK